MCKAFVLGMERNEFRRNYSLIAEVGIIFGTLLKESLHFCIIVDRKKILYLGIFVLCLLVFLFPPIVGALEVVLFEKIVRLDIDWSLFFLHHV